MSSAYSRMRDEVRRDRALAEAAEVGRDDPEVGGQRVQLRLPEGAVERMPVDQDDARSAAHIVVCEFHPFQTVSIQPLRPPSIENVCEVTIALSSDAR